MRVRVGRHEVAVVDTPGFDDTSRSDSEILEEIAEFLCAQYELGIPLKGIIYMHRITDNKVRLLSVFLQDTDINSTIFQMSGSAQRYFEMFNCLCGERNLSNIVLLTTMWSELSSQGKGLQRERELRSDFWGDMSAKGSTIRRFDGSRSMAEAFVCRLMRRQNIVLEIQNELVDQGLRLDETNAGRLIAPRLDRSIDEARSKIKSLGDLIDEAGNIEKPGVNKLRKQRASVMAQHKAKSDQRQRLKVRKGAEVAEKIEEGKRESRWKSKSKLGLFGSLLGLAISVTVKFILPLATGC